MHGHIRKAAGGGSSWKGLIDPGHTAGQAALTEAWEEAGLVGTLDPEPAGNYVYEKMGLSHHVLVYVMRVIEVRDSWPERGVRDREWLSVDDALDRIDEPGLRELLRRLFQVNHPDRISLVTA
ncbi:MAG: NUDIX domain-containing protein [Gemmataceae bacterium]